MSFAVAIRRRASAGCFNLVGSAGEGGIVLLAAAMAWLTDDHPLLLSVWGPWDFSWPAFLAIGLAVLWFGRGLRRAQPAARIAPWRSACFLVGVAAVYAVLLTRFEYIAQHMFFFNRLQHLVLHHFAPFLIALSWPGETIARGMPAPLRRCCTIAPLQVLLRVLRQPVIAAVLFEGLLILWLIPPVTFRAMIDARLYAVMNASMVIDGLLYWFVVLDPRPAPPAPIRFFTRFLLSFVIIFPQIGLGTLIGSAPVDLYPSFALCGRVYPAIGPLLDQQIGGLVLWVPAGMMSSLAALVVMARMFRHDDRVTLAASGMPRARRAA